MVRLSPSPLGRRASAAVLACSLLAGGAPSSLAQPKPAPTGKPAAPATAPAAASAPATGGKPGPGGKPAPSSSAAAGAEPPEMIDGTDELQKLYMEGDAALKRLAFTEAEQLFAKAWAQSKSFDVAAKLGETKLNMGKHREAAQYLAFAVRNALPSTRPQRRDRIKKWLDEAKQKLASVKLSASVVEARFSIDGASLDPIFYGPEIYVDPGKHTFEANSDGFVPASSEVEMKAGEIYVVTLAMERPAPKGVPTGPPPPPGTPWPAAAMGAAGGVAVIVGVVLVGLAESKKNEAYDLARNTLSAEGNPRCTRGGTDPVELVDRCAQVRTAAADADTFGNAGMGALIGAGVLIAGATAYMLFRPDPPPAAPDAGKPPPPTSRIVPVIGPSGGGLLWQGSF